MCTNRALVDSLECYMEDLVTCFEDFVKKSLILIFVGVGTVVVMLMYMLKALGGGNRTSAGTVQVSDTGGPVQAQESYTSIPSDVSKSILKQKPTKSDVMLQCEPKITCTSVNTMPVPMAAVPSFDERVLRDVGFTSCNKNNETKNQNLHVCPSIRLAIPSLPCLQEQHLGSRNYVKVLKGSSCCSICCADDK